MADEKLTRFPQLAKEPLIVGSSAPNTNNRLWAKAIDFGMITAVCAISNWIWAPSLLPVAILLWGNVEATGRGQSPGKWLLGLHTIEALRGRRPTLYNGIVRNLPFIILSLGLLWNSKWAWPLIFIGAAASLLELYFISRLKTGIRVGDIIGRTRVFDYKDEHTLFIERFLKNDQA